MVETVPVVLLESQSLAQAMNCRLHLPSVIVLGVRVCEWSRKCYSTQVSVKDSPKREVRELLPTFWNSMNSEKLLCKHQEIRDFSSVFSSSVAVVVATFLFLLFLLLSSFLSSVAFSNLTLQIPFAAWLQKNLPYSTPTRKPFWRWLPIFSFQCERKGNSFLPCFLLKQSSLQSYHQQTLAEAAHTVVQLTVTNKIKVVWFQHSSLILICMVPKEINLYIFPASRHWGSSGNQNFYFYFVLQSAFFGGGGQGKIRKSKLLKKHKFN